MFDDVRHEIGRMVGQYKPAALMLTGSPASLLLLHILFDIKAEFSVLCFDNSFTKEQRDVIDELVMEHGIRVFSYAPKNAYLIGDNRKRVSLVEEYAMCDGRSYPVIRDTKHEPSRCAVDDIKLGPFQEVAPLGFGLYLLDTLYTDSHYAAPNREISKIEYVSSGAVYYAPLAEMSPYDVRRGLKEYHVKPPAVDMGKLPMCTNCLSRSGPVFCPKRQKTIPSIDWDPSEMTTLFAKKYGYC